MFKNIRFMYCQFLPIGCIVFCLGIAQAMAFNPAIQTIKQQAYSITEQPARTKLHKLVHTKLEVNFDWEAQCLHGIATLQVQAHFYPQKQLILDAQGFIIRHIAIIEEEGKRALKYRYDNQKLFIDLGHTYTKEDVCLIEIAYTAQARPTKLATGWLLTENQGLYFINPTGKDPHKPRQIWTQGEPNTSSCWFPTIDAPNQKCTQEVYITVEDKYTTLSNGVLVYSTLHEDQTRTDYWSMELPHAPYLFMLVVGEFAKVQDEWNDIPVNYYVEPAYQPYAKAIFGHTPEMLDFFSEKLDYPYPWSSYNQVIVQDYLAGGMENTTAVVLSDALQVDERTLLDQDYDDILAHELFHHWFGNLVTCESWSHIVLNESLACLGSQIWQAYKHGRYASDWHIANTRNNYLATAKYKQASLIRPYTNQPLELFDSHTYHKGTLVLHMLKQYLGEEAFFQSLSHYLKKHAFTAVETHQLRKAFEEITGEDLNWFFNQWFLAPGHPVVEIEHTYVHGKVLLKVWQKQAAPSPIYRLPLSVCIWTKGRKEHYEILLEKPYQEFQWAVSQQPALVYIDPKNLLVGELVHPKTREEYQYLYQHVKSFFAKQEALSQLIKHHKDNPPAYYALLLEALQEKYWVFRVMAIEALAGYQSKNSKHMADRLVKLSKQDSHGAVRAAAIHTLSTWPNPSQYTFLYKLCLADSSYQVVAEALHAYATTSQEVLKAPIIAQFEAYDNLAIITTLANYYMAVKQPDKSAWFADKITRLYHKHGFDQFIPLWGTYISLLADSKWQDASLVIMRDIAKCGLTPKLQVALHKTLQELPQTKAVIRLMQEIKPHASNKNLSKP